MRSLPCLALVGVLGILLTACPGGAQISFTGTYSGTFGSREAAQLPTVLRGVTTLTVTLTQTGNIVSGSFTSTPPGPGGPMTGTITAAVITPGEATGNVDPDGPPPSISVNLFLTVNQDLVLQLPTEGNLAFVLQRL